MKTQTVNQKEIEKKIEKQLKKYNSYKAAIHNLERELNYIMPSITANYEYREGAAGNFSIYSTTENVAIDRVESSKALYLNEEKERLRLKVESMDKAIENLSDEEKWFIRLRYMQNKSYTAIAIEMQCSTSYIFSLRKGIMEHLQISLVHIVMEQS